MLRRLAPAYVGLFYDAGMASGLRRYQQTGHQHFITFSCYGRQGYLDTTAVRDLFLEALERTRGKYHLAVIGCVVMPEHVHLLVSEPGKGSLAVALQALKLSVSRRTKAGRFWQARYYDFNVFTEEKRVEKLEYMHWNPVRRGLVESPEDWRWSSYRRYCSGEEGPVGINLGWTGHRK